MSGLVVMNLMCVFGVNGLFFLNSLSLQWCGFWWWSGWCVAVWSSSGAGQTHGCCIRLCRVRWLRGGCWGSWSSAGAGTLARLRVLWGSLNQLTAVLVLFVASVVSSKARREARAGRRVSMLASRPQPRWDPRLRAWESAARASPQSSSSSTGLKPAFLKQNTEKSLCLSFSV